MNPLGDLSLRLRRQCEKVFEMKQILPILFRTLLFLPIVAGQFPFNRQFPVPPGPPLAVPPFPPLPVPPSPPFPVPLGPPPGYSPPNVGPGQFQFNRQIPVPPGPPPGNFPPNVGPEAPTGLFNTFSSNGGFSNPLNSFGASSGIPGANFGSPQQTFGLPSGAPENNFRNPVHNFNTSPNSFSGVNVDNFHGAQSGAAMPPPLPFNRPPVNRAPDAFPGQMNSGNGFANQGAASSQTRPALNFLPIVTPDGRFILHPTLDQVIENIKAKRNAHLAGRAPFPLPENSPVNQNYNMPTTNAPENRFANQEAASSQKRPSLDFLPIVTPDGRLILHPTLDQVIENIKAKRNARLAGRAPFPLPGNSPLNRNYNTPTTNAPENRFANQEAASSQKRPPLNFLPIVTPDGRLILHPTLDEVIANIIAKRKAHQAAMSPRIPLTPDNQQQNPMMDGSEIYPQNKPSVPIAGPNTFGPAPANPPQAIFPLNPPNLPIIIPNLNEPNRDNSDAKQDDIDSDIGPVDVIKATEMPSVQSGRESTEVTSLDTAENTPIPEGLFDDVISEFEETEETGNQDSAQPSATPQPSSTDYLQTVKTPQTDSNEAPFTETTTSNLFITDSSERLMPDTCAEDEEWWECVPQYKNTCKNFARALARVDFDCVPGCFCQDGMIKDDDGNCVEPEDCPDPVCEPHEEETDCANPCNSCAAQCRPCFMETCNMGCDCLDGFMRNENGTCIHVSQCPKCDSE